MENITFENHVIRMSFPDVRSIDEVKKTIELELGCKIKIISSGQSNLGIYITYKILKESSFLKCIRMKS